MLYSQEEAAPSTARPSFTGFTTAQAALGDDLVWERIEQWISYRWGSRTVTWVLDGGAEGYVLPLQPATVTDAYLWDGSAYNAITLVAGPIGYTLPDGIIKIVATVGDTGTLPASVNQAAQRLAGYWVETPPGAVAQNQANFNIGPVGYQSNVPSSWVGQAMQLSGAADLLRKYRKVYV